MLLVIISALGVVYTKFQARKLFLEIKKLESELNTREIEWGQLQLEQTTLQEHNQIERLARERLNLRYPKRNKIVYLKH